MQYAYTGNMQASSVRNAGRCLRQTSALQSQALDISISAAIWHPVRHQQRSVSYRMLQLPSTLHSMQQPIRRKVVTCVAAETQQQREQPAGAVTTAALASASATPPLIRPKYEPSSSPSTSSDTSISESMTEDSSSEVSTDDAASSSSSSNAGLSVLIKVLSEPQELNAVAKLRAEAYYAEDHSRFAASFKKQFAAQEVDSLRQRTTPTTSSQRPQLCDCLVAVDASNGSVLGCIDIRLPQSYTGMKTIGVPDGDSSGCYLLNVVVAEEHRGLGVGKQLMRAAMSRAVHHWGAQRMYTHVEADNEVAGRLYKGCGFQEHSSESKYASALNLGRLVLLMATSDQAIPLEASTWAISQ